MKQPRGAALFVMLFSVAFVFTGCGEAADPPQDEAQGAQSAEASPTADEPEPAPPECESDGSEDVLMCTHHNKFNTDQIRFEAGEATKLRLLNHDEASHNVSLYRTSSFDRAIFEGEFVPGGDSAVYRIKPMNKGRYFFQCDIHPIMDGTVDVG